MKKNKQLMNLLLIVCVVLLVLWGLGLGLVTSYSMGGAIHFLAVIALILFVAWFVSGRKKIL